MKMIKWAIGTLVLLAAMLGIYFVLRSEQALVIHPKGVIAREELHLITINVLLMLLVIVPTCVWLLVVAWRYRSTRPSPIKKMKRGNEKLIQVILWAIPSVVVGVMSWITWGATHRLDPYRPLESEIKPFVIQVVSLDWKWLFIYPEDRIASVNFVQFPEKTPIRFELTSDGSPMNSFWIPQLSGQIYCMTGMVTPLHVMADGLGTYSGKAAEINGEGYARMTFKAQSTSPSDFQTWVSSVKKTALQLTQQTYDQLIKPSEDNPVVLYSDVDRDLFHQIIMKYMP